MSPTNPTSKVWRDYLNTQKAKLEDDGKILTDQENQTSRTLLNQLFVTAGGIIALATPFLFIAPLSNLAPWTRYLLLITIALSACSIMCGLIQLNIDRSFFERNRAEVNGMIGKISEGRIQNYQQLEALYAKSRYFPVNSSNWFERIQFGSLTLSGIGFIIAVGYALVSTR
jgi:hypothetical protein